MISKITSKEKNPKKFSFSTEQKNFLGHLLKGFQNLNEDCLWRLVAQMFNERFPLSTRTKKEIKSYFQNCVRTDLRKGKLSDEEKGTFAELKEKGNKTLAQIAREMNRTPQSIKNYYYRGYLSCKDRNISSENFNFQFEEEIITFKNDYQFYGI
jgi:hypothetical protein